MQGFDIDNLHIRPRFGFSVPFSPTEVLHRLQHKLDSENATCKGRIVDDHVTIDIPSEDQHFWSPQMSFEVEENEEDQSGQSAYIRGLFGPRPPVWTMFMFFYAFIGFIGLFLSMYGMTQWTLGEFSITIFGFPIAFILMGTAYLAGKSGEKLGHDQIEQLKQFFKSALKEQ